MGPETSKIGYLDPSALREEWITSSIPLLSSTKRTAALGEPGALKREAGIIHGSHQSTRRAPYGLVQECTLNDMGTPNNNSGILRYIGRSEYGMQQTLLRHGLFVTCSADCN